MKTDLPHSDHEKLKALLANSFHSEEADDAPPLPDDLRERIRDQYGQAQSAARPGSEQQSESWFGKLSRLFAQPAFQGAAAAVVLLTVAGLFLLPGPEVTRGEASFTSVKIVLHGFDAERGQAITETLDPKAVTTVGKLNGHLAGDTPTIVIDGSAGEIRGYSGPEAEAKTVPLPERPAQIAFEVAKMKRQLEE